MKKVCFIVFFLYVQAYLGASPDWMERQIASDLASFENTPYCKKCMARVFQENQQSHLLCKCVIRKNRVTLLACDYILHNPVCERYWAIYNGLADLATWFSLPDVTFYLTLHDSSKNIPTQSPLWAMAKPEGNRGILFPDFEILTKRYRILDNHNPEIEDFLPPWEERKECLIWRGSGVQGEITPQNMHEKSRVKLCQLSQEYPQWVDAGFSFCIPSHVEQYRKKRLPYEEILKYKYQMWIDGNTASYSDSGWRLFSGSTVLKPVSKNIQWYYGALEPDQHYISVKEDLSDLIEKLVYLHDHQEYACQVAKNSVSFARAHLNYETSLLYLHDLLWAYSKLPWTFTCPNCKK
ncbi:MAG: hypothetical protein K940chlam9_01132 [Chlamydiae bacterium]|nr:hypothetical protein [Chlamydiota bacterium]